MVEFVKQVTVEKEDVLQEIFDTMFALGYEDEEGEYPEITRAQISEWAMAGYSAGRQQAYQDARGE